MDPSLVHPQLKQVAAELDAAEESVKALSSASDETLFLARPDPDRWSAGENIIHLNLTTASFVPLLNEVIDEDPNPRVGEDHVLRRDILGAFLTWAVEPPHRHRMKTTAPFLPRGGKSRAEIVAEFSKLQHELQKLLAKAQTHDLAKLRIVSPFDARLRYNVYSAFRVLPAHQRRHLWQAQNAMRSVI